VEIKIRRNGRLEEKATTLGSGPEEAYYFATNDVVRWCQDHPENKTPITEGGTQ
jgi:hypothetical protein